MHKLKHIKLKRDHSTITARWEGEESCGCGHVDTVMGAAELYLLYTVPSLTASDF